MGIFKRYWEHSVSSTLLFRLLGATILAALVFGALAYYKSAETTIPQAERRCCFDNKAVLFFSLPGTHSFSSLLLPLIQYTAIEDIPYLEVKSGGMTWKATALKTESVGALLAEFSQAIAKEKLHSLISVILDSTGAEYLLLIGKEGQISLSSMKFLIERFLVDFKGKPSVEIHIPHEWGAHVEHAPFYLKTSSR